MTNDTSHDDGPVSIIVRGSEDIYKCSCWWTTLYSLCCARSASGEWTISRRLDTIASTQRSKAWRHGLLIVLLPTLININVRQICTKMLIREIAGSNLRYILSAQKHLIDSVTFGYWDLN